MGAILHFSTLGNWSVAATLAAAAAFAPAAAAQLPASACVPDATEVRVASVPDPRSVVLEDGRILRLAGIESFGLLMPEAEDAEEALLRRMQALLAGRVARARLLSEGADRYGRLPALLALSDGVLAQETLAREGVAVAYGAGDPIACFDRILAAETDARRNTRGLWTDARLPQAQPQFLASRIGRFAIFEGRVISVGTRRARTYLNFGRRWSDDVTVEIEDRHRDRFGGEAKLAELAGRRVRVRGFVEDRAGPLVHLTSPMQIEVLGAPTRVSGNGEGSTP